MQTKTKIIIGVGAAALILLALMNYQARSRRTARQRIQRIN